jgi:hypothetical protein
MYAERETAAGRGLRPTAGDQIRAGRGLRPTAGDQIRGHDQGEPAHRGPAPYNGTAAAGKALREEFEPQLISPYGLHLDIARCARGWDTWPLDEAGLLAQIEAAAAWLSQVERTKSINPRIGTSYELKHIAEAWAGRYISNGCFLMAAHRLGFRMAGTEAIHWPSGPDRLDCWNTYIDISTRSVRRLTGRRA